MRHSFQIAAVAAIFPIAVLVPPAHAGLQIFASVIPGAQPPLTCAPPSSGSCVYGGSANNTLTFTPVPFVYNGEIVNGDLFTATGVPGAPGIDSLDVSSLALINTTSAPVTVTLVLSDTDFAAPVGIAKLATSGTFQATVGSTFTVKWFADPSNTQGADTSGSTPGTLLDTFTTTATGIAQSFNDNSTQPFTATSPFSMTEEVIYTLQPNGELLNRGVGMVATNVPEPSTWVMMALGFAGLGFLGHRSSRTKIAMID
jgi:hypothetical protein